MGLISWYSQLKGIRHLSEKAPAGLLLPLATIISPTKKMIQTSTKPSEINHLGTVVFTLQPVAWSFGNLSVSTCLIKAAAFRYWHTVFDECSFCARNLNSGKRFKRKKKEKQAVGWIMWHIRPPPFSHGLFASERHIFRSGFAEEGRARVWNENTEGNVIHRYSQAGLQRQPTPRAASVKITLWKQTTGPKYYKLESTAAAIRKSSFHFLSTLLKLQEVGAIK